MEILTNTDTSTAAQSSKPADNAATATSASDFNTFLTLLTAQMRNQDPLKPMESTEFVAQLASFSAVEQQIETNSKLAELIGMFGENSSANLTQWIGKEVRREGATEFNGNPVSIGIAANPSADSARLVVRDSNANQVFVGSVDPTDLEFIWNGERSDGGMAERGRYSFDIESYDGGSLIASQAGSVFDVVSEVRLEHGDTILIFEDGAHLNADEATAVRLAQS